jgi:hypothetical protein
VDDLGLKLVKHSTVKQDSYPELNKDIDKENIEKSEGSRRLLSVRDEESEKESEEESEKESEKESEEDGANSLNKGSEGSDESHKKEPAQPPKPKEGAEGSEGQG